MADAEDKDIPDHAHEAAAERNKRREEILAGALPSTDELLTGTPWFGGEIAQDIRVWCDSWLLSDAINTWQTLLGKSHRGMRIRPAIQNLRDVQSIDALKTVQLILEKIEHDDVSRMLCYRACKDDDAGRHALVARSQREAWDRHGYAKMQVTATTLGVCYHRRDSMLGYYAIGRNLLRADALILRTFEAAEAHARDAAAQVEIKALRGMISEIAPDAIGILRDPVDDEEEAEGPSLIAVPKLPEAGTGHRKEIAKSWKGIDGEPLPIVTRGDIAARRRSLIERWPHAVDAIDMILGDLAAREQVRFRPTLLVGSPGSGKSSLARAICDAFGLPSQLYNVPTAADSSLAGTSAQWSTAREAIPLQLIKQSKMASVAVIWDEIEKAPSGDYNGSALAALLPLLEIDQARRFRDLALEVECDLSMVSNFATANSTTGIPAPLRDRMRIIRVPEPGWQHISQLTRQIIERIEEERKLRRGWYQPLAQDEAEVIREFWASGSLRQLTSAVQATLDVRDKHMARC